MMENLTVILQNMSERLEELESTLAEENRQLSQAQINPVSLQVVSDNKSRLLSAVNFFDEQRRQEEVQRRFTQPYAGHRQLSSAWEGITRVVKKCNELNQQSYQLLEMHLKKANDVKKLVSQATPSSLYGESGDRRPQEAGNAYRISV